MKIAVCIALTLMMILTGCAGEAAKPGGNDVSLSDDVQTSENDVSLTTEAAQSSETSITANEAPETTTLSEKTDNSHGLGDITAPTKEDIQKIYPDKTVLSWGIYNGWGTYKTMRTAEINQYLDSLGKSYAVCFVPIDDVTIGEDHSLKSDANYPAAVERCISQGAEFDLIFGIGNLLMVSSDLYAPISSYLENTEAGRKLYELMPESYWKACSFGSEVYGIGNPAEILNKPYCYYYNAEMVEKYNYDMDKSPLEQIDILKKIKEENPETTVFATSPIAAYIKPYSTARHLDNALYWDDEAKQEKCSLDNEAYINEARTIHELEALGLAHIISNGLFGDSFFIYAVAEDYYKGDSELYDVTIMDKTFTGCYKKIFSDGDRIKNIFNVNGVAESSKHKDKAFDLLALCCSDPKLNNLMCYGVEGEDYIIEDGKANGSSIVSAGYFFANSLICLPSQREAADYAKIIRERIDSALYDEAISFQPDVSKFRDKLVDNSGNTISIGGVMVEFANAVSNADADFDETVSQYRRKLMDMGLQEIIDDINRQYKFWEESAR